MKQACPSRLSSALRLCLNGRRASFVKTLQTHQSPIRWANRNRAVHFQSYSPELRSPCFSTLADSELKEGTNKTSPPESDQHSQSEPVAEEAEGENNESEEGVGVVERLQAEVEELKSTLAEAKEQANENKETSLRYLADMENVRERCRKDLDAGTKFAVQKFAKSLLDTADTLGMAIVAAKNPQTEIDPEARFTQLLEGVEMTERGLQKAFNEVGVVKFESLGQKFDPNVHDGLFEMPDPSRETGEIGAVLKEGYMINDRVLRAANVGTVKNT